MSVGSDISRVQYEGNGSTETAYAVPFAFFDAEDLKVVVRDAGGGELFLTAGADYTVEMAEEPPGGSVTTATAWDDTHTITIYRYLEATQTTSYVENADFPARSHERALDKLTMLVQQLGRAIGRAFRMRESDGEAAEVARQSDTVFGIGADGDPVFRDADAVKTWLSLAAPILNFPTKVWADAAERALAVPDFVGQVGVQADESTIWASTGLDAGDWSSPIGGIPDGSIATVMLAAGLLSANSAGRAKMADGYLSADSEGRAKMADQFVTFAKMQNIATARLLGRATAGSGAPEEITLGTGLSLAGSTLNASGASPSGSVIQVQYAEYTTNEAMGSLIPRDNSIPQSGEGKEILSLSITPSSASSKILLQFHGFGALDSDNAQIQAALFRDSGANAICATCSNANAQNSQVQIALQYQDSPATASAVTYKVRVGDHNSTALRMNGNQNGRLLGGASRCTLVAMEIKG